MADLQKIQSSVISLKAIFQTGLAELDKIEKELSDVKKPSKRVLDKQARIDARVIRKRTLIEKNKNR